MTANAKGKKEFFEKTQIYIDLVPDSANVAFIASQIKEHWGQKYKLVTCDGLEIEDSSTTRGTLYILY